MYGNIIISAATVVDSLLDVSDHRCHPEAKSLGTLDQEIQNIARKNFNISRLGDIQVVDDLCGHSLARSWGCTYLGPLAKPVIALQKDIQNKSEKMRKICIAKELYMVSSPFYLIQLALKVAVTVQTLPILANLTFAFSMSTFYVLGKVLLISLVASIVEQPVEWVFRKRSEAFARKLLGADPEVTIRLNEETLTALDLPVTLRPANLPEGEVKEFFAKREKYHLDQIKRPQFEQFEDKMYYQLGFNGIAMAIINHLSPDTKTFFMGMHVANVVIRRFVDQVVINAKDIEFKGENPVPAGFDIKDYPGVFEGSLKS